MNKVCVCSVLSLILLDAVAAVPVRPMLSPPPFVPAVPGKTCEIYFRSVTDAVRPEIYGYDVRCAVGRNDGTAWRWTPTEADAGRKIRLVLSLVSDLGVLSTATTSVQVAKLPADRKRPLTLALLADSLTNCLYQDRLLDNMRAAGFSGYRPVGSRTGYSASPVGTFTPGKAAHDGYGGYSWRGFMNTYAYTTDEIDNLQSEAERRQLEKDGVKIEPGKEWRRHLLKSPLLRMVKGKKTVDIKGWFDRINGGRAPDVILIALGGNDIFLREDNGKNYKGEDVLRQVRRNIDIMLDALRAAAPEAVFAVATAPVGGIQPAFASNYGCMRTDFMFRSNALCYNRMLEEVIAARKDPKLVLAPVHHALDHRKAYPADNALHPTPEGGRMMGDAFFAWLVGSRCFE